MNVEVKKMTRRCSTLALLCAILLAGVSGVALADASFGFHALFGGRYDDVRMCVGSPAGVKGGPIGEVYFDIRIPAGEDSSLVINVPLFRPILFGASFKMLQFEPQVTYETVLGPDGGPQWVAGAGLGAVFHYGPDYLSDPDNRSENFFSVGPLLTGSVGLQLGSGPRVWTPGIKAFYAPIFSADYANGTVLGGGVEVHYGQAR